MKRPLVLFVIFLIGGILAAQMFASILPVIIISLAVMLFSVLLCMKFNICSLGVIIAAAVFFLAGALEFTYMNQIALNRLSEMWSSTVSIRGYIASEPEVKETKTSYVVKISEISSGEKVLKNAGRVLLSMPREELNEFLRYGSEIKFSGLLNPLKGVRNPGGFDYRRYMAKLGVSGTVFCRESDVEVTGNAGGNKLIKIGLAFRGRIIAIVDSTLPVQQAGLLNGMLIGYREGLDKDVQQAFSDAGLTHLMAVSGANVAFIMLPFAFVFKRLRVKQKIADIGLIFIVVFFLFITGFSPSVTRAVIMAVIVLIGKIMWRESDVLTGIAFAALAILLYNPFNLFDIGFQLSFVATLALVLFSRNIKQLLSFKWMPEMVADAVSVTLAAQIGVLPVAAYYFNKVSIISIFSNLVVIPVVELVTVIGLVMTAAGQVSIAAAQAAAYVNSTFLSFILYVTRVSSQVPFAVVRMSTPPLILVPVYYLAVIFFFWYKPSRKPRIKAEYYAAAAMMCAVLIIVPAAVPRGLEVVFLDVGEGDSAFVRTCEGKTLFIDGGGYNTQLNPQANIGDDIVVPFLMDHDAGRLDAVIATHGHEDHIQGLRAVLRDLKVSNLFVPDVADKKELESLMDIAGENGTEIHFLSKGEEVVLDGRTELKVLHPPQNFKMDKSALNNGSLVLKLIYGSTSVLFAGDVESEAEEILLSRCKELQADVLKIAHHGSSGSSGESFLRAVAPEAAVISVGKNNFGHPSDETLERLGKMAVKLFRTDRDGGIILKSNGRSMTIKGTIKNGKWGSNEY